MAKKVIDGKDKNPDNAVEIEVDDDNDVVSKTIPAPTDFENGKITWFNAFEVKPGRVSKRIPSYKVRFKRPAPVNNNPRRIFYYYESQPHEVESAKLTDEGDGYISFRLNLGDPPVGYYP
jgi:hypothetical protein